MWGCSNSVVKHYAVHPLLPERIFSVSCSCVTPWDINIYMENVSKLYPHDCLKELNQGVGKGRYLDPKMSILGTAWRAGSPLEILSGTVERAADLFNSTRDPKEPPRTPKDPPIDLKGPLRNPKGAQGPSKVSQGDPK